MPTPTSQKLGWIGAGRMGYAMAERLAKGGCDIAVWNRTRDKALPLEKSGAKVVNQLEELSTKDILFVMVSTYDDVKEVLAKALAKGKPKMVVECSSISLEGSAELRQMLKGKGIQYLAAPVSGNSCWVPSRKNYSARPDVLCSRLGQESRNWPARRIIERMTRLHLPTLSFIASCTRLILRPTR